MDIANDTLVRVTEVLDWVEEKEITQWRGRIGNKKANRILKDALETGTALHSYIAARLVRKEVKLPDNPSSLKMACVAASSWMDLNDFTVVAVEQTLVNEEAGYRGTPDLLTNTHVVDWKTSRYLNWKHVWQVNAYMELATKAYGRDYSHATLVRFDKMLGTFEECTVDFDVEMYESFLGLARAYRYWKENHGSNVAYSEDSTK